MQPSTDHVNSTTSRKSVHATIMSTNGQPVQCSVAVCQSELSSANSMRNHLRRFHRSLNIVMKICMPTSEQHSVNVVHVSRFVIKRRMSQKQVLEEKPSLRIGLWNVRTLQATQSCPRISSSSNSFMGYSITETHLPGCGCMELDDQSGCNLYFSGMADVAARGVGLIMQLDAAKSLMCFDPISDRVMWVDVMIDRGVLKGKSNKNELKTTRRKLV